MNNSSLRPAGQRYPVCKTYAPADTNQIKTNYGIQWNYPEPDIKIYTIRGGREICKNNQCATSSDPVAAELYKTVKKVYEFFENIFNFRGIDGKGKIAKLYINWQEHNAQWSCSSETINEVCQFKFNNTFAVTEEVVAHEYFHAIMNGRLTYKGQSGALDESLADVFGIAFKHWSIDKEILENDNNYQLKRQELNDHKTQLLKHQGSNNHEIQELNDYKNQLIRQQESNNREIQQINQEVINIRKIRTTNNREIQELNKRGFLTLAQHESNNRETQLLKRKTQLLEQQKLNKREVKRIDREMLNISKIQDLNEHKLQLLKPQELDNSKIWLITGQILVNRKTWWIGNLRDLSIPSTMERNYKQDLDEDKQDLPRYDEENDYGYVHDNSCIPSHAFYLACQSGSGRTWGIIAQIWFRASQNRTLENNETFETFAHRTIEVAKEFEMADIVHQAWSSVGVLSTISDNIVYDEKSEEDQFQSPEYKHVGF
ncbi:M4 family metallopeptidase [Candidatus Protochlamydia amoebophila]|uniref:Putative metalloproteinase n=1 Tax=Candidatus Protochlamydia amoebophila TaxID=362787 RepID=A0A0C1JJJ6_9BACT|nr:M4 family metallopeptidase [Candidatus Protochlamydia amoebophila]KIC70761.1 putative metalloproteinase [Candidatus Protochlamydia amoebophila]